MIRIPSDPARRASLIASLGLAVLIASCSSGGGTPSSSHNPGGGEAVPNTVTPMRAPSQRTQQMVDKINRLRSEAYGQSMPITASDVCYTAAFRHATYLNTCNSLNCTQWTRGEEAPVITPEVNDGLLFIGMGLGEGVSPWDALKTEPVRTGMAGPQYIFPALYTSNNPRTRVEAVIGGSDILGRQRENGEVYEGFVFNGSIWRSDGKTPYFIGFNMDGVEAPFDEVDNLWYTRQGRATLMRASTYAFGYAAVNDSDRFVPPYPILHGRFRGAMVAVGSRPLTSLYGSWPKNGSTDVLAYGLDTDVGRITTYSGPPMHISLPVAEPIDISPGSLRIRFSKVNPQTPLPPTPFYVVYANTSTVPVLGRVEGPLDYSVAGGGMDIISNATVARISPCCPNGLGSIIEFYEVVNVAAAQPGDIVTLSGADQWAEGLNRGSGMTYQVVIVDRAKNRLWVMPRIISVTQTIVDPNGFVIPGRSEDVLINPAGDRDVRATCTSPNYTPTKTDTDLRHGEVFVMPVSPLEPNTTYRLEYDVRTVSSIYSRTLEFTTNGKIPPY